MFDPNDIALILQRVVDLYLLPRFRELNMPATGEWQRNLEVVPGTDSGTIRGRDYSQQLALGRRPGRRPPVAPLQKWAMAKFGMGPKEALSMAYAVAKKIEKEGTTWYQKGGSNLIEVLQEPHVIDYIQTELAAIARVQVAERLQRNATDIF